MLNTFITRIKNLFGFKNPEVIKETTIPVVVQTIEEVKTPEIVPEVKAAPVKKARKPRAKKARK